MTRKQLLQKIKYHWHSYVARGGLAVPRTSVGKLEKGGVEHWAMFLQAAKQFVIDYNVDDHDFDFLPPPVVKLVLGE